MINILIISPTGGYAGIDVCIESLVYGIDKSIFNPIVVFPLQSKLQEEFEDKGIRCYRLPLNWWFPIGYSGNDIVHSLYSLPLKVDPLVQIIKDNNIDLVLSNTSVCLDGAVAANICGVPHMFFLHASFVDNIYTNMMASTKKNLYTLMGQLSDKVICCSELLNQLISKYTDNSMCIYNGVDIDKFKFKERILHEDEKLNIVCVGHYNANKQQDFVIKAMKYIKVIRPDLLKRIHYTMIGPGEAEYISYLRSLVDKNGLRGNVTFKGFCDNIQKQLDEFNIYVNSSITENLPVSVIEAMSNGMPILGSKNDGTLQLIKEGETGFICETPEEMADKMIYLLENQEVVQKMSIAARKRVEENFSLVQYIKGFEQAMKEVVMNSNRDSLCMDQVIKCLYELVYTNKICKANKYKVLVIYPKEASATYYIAAKNPLDFLSEDGILEYTAVTRETVQDSDIENADLVYCVRYFDDYIYSKLEYAKSINKPFIWYIDDNYFALKFENGEVIHTSTENDMYKKMFLESDAVIVNSGELFHVGNALKANVYRLPTYQILDNNTVTEKKENIIRIGFMGTLKRDNDFDTVIPALKRIKSEYGNNVELEFVGYYPECLKNEAKVFEFIYDYNEFRRFLASRKWDIALAPLGNTVFNLSKTNNKYREYSSFKIAGVYSDILTYNTCVKDQVNGILVNNDEDSWYKGIKKLIDSKELRDTLAKNAYDDIVENYNICDFSYALSNVFVNISNQVALKNQAQNVVVSSDESVYRRTNQCTAYIPSDFLNYSRKICKSRKYRVISDSDYISSIGILFATEGSTAKGEVTLSVYYRGTILRQASMKMKNIDYNTWNYFEIQPLVGSMGRELILKLEFAYEPDSVRIGVYEDCEHRTYLYKLLNRLGMPMKGKNTLCVHYN